MVNFVVTGANKGIGFEIVKGLLDASAKAFVFLGSRDTSRGASAVEALLAQNPESYTGRVEVLQIDVSDDGSVSQAAQAVRSRLQSGGDGGGGSSSCLGALINNAGMAPDGESHDVFESCININFRGVVRTTEAFLPLLEPSKGRVVITSSASGPMFVAKCSPERQALFVDPAVTRAQIDGLLDECQGIASSGGGSMEEKFAAAGLKGVEGAMGVYGLSKALVNMYMVQLARDNPELIVNAATPGFIKTDLTKPFETSEKTLDDMGAKSPAEGAKVLVHLAMADVASSGWYFGSDLERSPLDRYRGPGDPPYVGK